MGESVTNQISVDSKASSTENALNKPSRTINKPLSNVLRDFLSRQTLSGSNELFAGQLSGPSSSNSGSNEVFIGQSFVSTGTASGSGSNEKFGGQPQGSTALKEGPGSQPPKLPNSKQYIKHGTPSQTPKSESSEHIGAPPWPVVSRRFKAASGSSSVSLNSGSNENSQSSRPVETGLNRKVSNQTPNSGSNNHVNFPILNSEKRHGGLKSPNTESNGSVIYSSIPNLSGTGESQSGSNRASSTSNKIISGSVTNENTNGFNRPGSGTENNRSGPKLPNTGSNENHSGSNPTLSGIRKGHGGLNTLSSGSNRTRSGSQSTYDGLKDNHSGTSSPNSGPNENYSGESFSGSKNSHSGLNMSVYGTKKTRSGGSNSPTSGSSADQSGLHHQLSGFKEMLSGSNSASSGSNEFHSGFNRPNSQTSDKKLPNSRSDEIYNRRPQSSPNSGSRENFSGAKSGSDEIHGKRLKPQDSGSVEVIKFSSPDFTGSFSYDIFRNPPTHKETVDQNKDTTKRQHTTHYAFKITDRFTTKPPPNTSTKRLVTVLHKPFPTTGVSVLEMFRRHKSSTSPTTKSTQDLSTKRNPTTPIVPTTRSISTWRPPASRRPPSHTTRQTKKKIITTTTMTHKATTLSYIQSNIFSVSTYNVLNIKLVISF